MVFYISLFDLNEFYYVDIFFRWDCINNLCKIIYIFYIFIKLNIVILFIFYMYINIFSKI